MNAKTLKALKASIAKWKLNAKAEHPRDVLLGADKCPLCELFNNDQSYAHLCVGCPVFWKTGHTFCTGTPYNAVHGALYRWDNEGDREAFVNASKAEVAFLQSLLPSRAAS